VKTVLTLNKFIKWRKSKNWQRRLLGNRILDKLPT